MENHNDYQVESDELEGKGIAIIKWGLTITVLLFFLLLIVIGCNEAHIFKESTFSRIGTIGDFFGGFLSPILSIAASILFLSSLRLQMAEFKESRREFKEEMKSQLDELKETRQVHLDTFKEGQRKRKIEKITALIDALENTESNIRGPEDNIMGYQFVKKRLYPAAKTFLNNENSDKLIPPLEFSGKYILRSILLIEEILEEISFACRNESSEIYDELLSIFYINFPESYLMNWKIIKDAIRNLKEDQVKIETPYFNNINEIDFRNLRDEEGLLRADYWVDLVEKVEETRGN